MRATQEVAIPPTDPDGPLRVGLIAPPWLTVPPRGYGGTETVIDLLARGLFEAGHEVVLFTTGDSACPVERRFVLDAAPGIDVGGSPVEVHHVLGAYASLEDVDLVHDHTAVGPLVAQAGGRRAVTTNHNPFAPPFDALYRATAARVPVIAISRDQAARARGIPIAAVIHHGIDTRRVPLGRGEGGFALFLGRMAPDKGPHRAIIAARAAGLPLVVAGSRRSPAEHAYFEASVAPLLGGDVSFVGEVDAEEKVALLGAAIALVNPIGWDEPFGMVMLEALATGTPVVALRRGSAPELIEDGVTGALADDVDELAAALAGAGAFDRVACRRAAEGHFGQGRMVEEHVALYRRVLAGAVR